MDWRRVGPDFEADGSLRDLYVHGTGLDDWQSAVEALRGRWPLTFTLDGEPAALPGHVGEIFRGNRDQGALLSLTLAGARLISHFFVAGPAQIEALAEFMALLGRATARSVVLTPEDAPQRAILRSSPECDEVRWVEPHFISGRGTG